MLDELLSVLAQQRRDPAQHRGALGGGHPRPRTLVEGPPRRADRRVDLGGAAVGSLREHLVGRRVERLEGAAIEALPERAVEIVALEPDAGPGSRSVLLDLHGFHEIDLPSLDVAESYTVSDTVSRRAGPLAGARERLRG